MKMLAYRLVVCVALLGCTAGCQETTTLPTVPSPLSEERVGVLAIACPTDQVVQSLNGVDGPVPYSPPQVSGGQAPVESSCDPVSGATHAIGTTAATCSASDDLGQTASCSFVLRVLPMAKISKVRFLAFGDSLTAGVTSEPVATILEASKSYPFRLQQMLANKYPTQTITIANAGLQGEKATEGVSRIGGQLDGVRPDVVLIMEGTNDVGTPNYTVSGTGGALEGMVAEAQARGVDAIIATLPPIRPVGAIKVQASQNIIGLNGFIQSIGFSRGIPQLDLFSVVSQGSCVPFSTSFPCIGVDHIHPTAQGYELMAQAFFNLIVQTYDITASGAHAPSRRSPLGSVR